MFAVSQICFLKKSIFLFYKDFYIVTKNVFQINAFSKCIFINLSKNIQKKPKNIKHSFRQC